MSKICLFPLFWFMFAILLNGSMSFAAEITPCDQYGSGCASKAKINQW
jgi:hypothetical protein